MVLMDLLVRRCCTGVPRELEAVAFAEGMEPERFARRVAEGRIVVPKNPARQHRSCAHEDRDAFERGRHAVETGTRQDRVRVLQGIPAPVREVHVARAHALAQDRGHEQVGTQQVLIVDRLHVRESPHLPSIRVLLNGGSGPDRVRGRARSPALEDVANWLSGGAAHKICAAPLRRFLTQDARFPGALTCVN